MRPRTYLGRGRTWHIDDTTRGSGTPRAPRSPACCVLALGTAVADRERDCPAPRPTSSAPPPRRPARSQARGHDGTGVTVAVIDTGVADVPGIDGKRHPPGEHLRRTRRRRPVRARHVRRGPRARGRARRRDRLDQALRRQRLGRRHAGARRAAVGDRQQGALLDRRRQPLVRQRLEAVRVREPAQLRGAAGLGRRHRRRRLRRQPRRPARHRHQAGRRSADHLRRRDRRARHRRRASDDTIPAFVSRGPTQDGLSKPDLVAPGTRLVSLRAPGSTVDIAAPAGARRRRTASAAAAPRSPHRS